MKKLLLMLAFIFVVVPLAHTADNNNWGGSDRTRLLGRELPYDMIYLGQDRGGVSTVISTTTAITAGYKLVAKVLHVSEAQACTLANGVPGQLITIYAISGGGSGGSAVITPATKTGYATITLDAIGESVALQYLDDTYGWVLVGKNAATISQ